MRAIAMAAAALALFTSATHAQSIENACLRSNREAKSRALCGCIQQAANLTLTAKDQKLASSFYKNPQLAQDVRQSGRRQHSRFWDRYKDYAEMAETFCS